VEERKSTNNMNNESFSTHGVWGTYESLLNKDKNSFQNPFDYDLWILMFDDLFSKPTDSISDKLKEYSYSKLIQSHNRENLDIFLL
jgi:hypothetical protein